LDENLIEPSSSNAPAEILELKQNIPLSSIDVNTKLEESPVTISVDIGEDTQKYFADINSQLQSIVKSNAQTAVAALADSLKPSLTLGESILNSLHATRLNGALNFANLTQTTLSMNKTFLESFTSSQNSLLHMASHILEDSSNSRLIALTSQIASNQNEMHKSFTELATQIALNQQDLRKPFGELWLALSNAVSSFQDSFTLSPIIIDPLMDDILQSEKGDLAAAGRLADRIPWAPNSWQKAAINLKAKITGKSPEEIRLEALTKAVSSVLSWDDNDSFPILIKPQSTWAYDTEKKLITICPNELPVSLFWRWVKEEAARAAGLWLVEHPYAATFVVEEPPSEYLDIHLVKFTSDSENYRLDALRGRPVGSGVFENRELFLNEIRLAATKIQERGNRITQERVAEVLSEKGFAGPGNPIFQLRRWTKEFGFLNWSDLLPYL